MIIDGAAGLPLPERGGKTCLELAQTPNMDEMIREGVLGLARTVPAEMEPSSACACLSILGYDPKVYYRGRAGIEAKSMGIPIAEGEVVFRCNLVAIDDGKMWDYSAGHISTDEAQQLIGALNDSLGSGQVHFYPGIGYRHIGKLKGHEDALLATCTPPHNIPGKPISQFMPYGPGSDLLRELMLSSEAVLREHPVNVARRSRGDIPATMLWFFWGSGQAPDMPPFKQVYGLEGLMTSGVDLLHGLGQMVGMDALDIAGVTDGLDNDYAAQGAGALEALGDCDLVIIHIEATDEAAHTGLIDSKIAALQVTDKEVLSRLRSRHDLRVLVMPDHPTPVTTRVHSSDPVPFLLWGPGFTANGASRFTENEAAKTGLFIDPGYTIMTRLIGINGSE